MKKIQAVEWISLSSKKSGKASVLRLASEQKRIISDLEDLKARLVFNTMTNSEQSIIDELNNKIALVTEQFTELSLAIKKEKLKCLDAS